MATSPHVVILKHRMIMLPDHVIDFQCVARTTKRRRCALHVEGPQQTGWAYMRKPGDADSMISVYDIGFIDDDETTRWLQQHCPFHHQRDSVIDFVAVEWSPFDPGGYVWTYPNRADTAWVDDEPVTGSNDVYVTRGV